MVLPTHDVTGVSHHHSGCSPWEGKGASLLRDVRRARGGGFFFFFFFDFAKENCTLELVIDKCGIQKRSIFERTAVCLRKARGGQSAVTLNFNCLCCTGGVA